MKLSGNMVLKNNWYSQETSIIVQKEVNFYFSRILKEAKSDEKNPGTGDLQANLF